MCNQGRLERKVRRSERAGCAIGGAWRNRHMGDLMARLMQILVQSDPAPVLPERAPALPGGSRASSGPDLRRHCDEPVRPRRHLCMVVTLLVSGRAAIARPL